MQLDMMNTQKPKRLREDGYDRLLRECREILAGDAGAQSQTVSRMREADPTLQEWLAWDGVPMRESSGTTMPREFQDAIDRAAASERQKKETPEDRLDQLDADGIPLLSGTVVAGRAREAQRARPGEECARLAEDGIPMVGARGSSPVEKLNEIVNSLAGVR